MKRTATLKIKRVLTPEQIARLVGSMMADADRRAQPVAPSGPVSDEDMRSFPGVRDERHDYGIRADRDGD